MREISAVIRWRTPAEGGPEKILDTGIRYFPTVIRGDDKTHTHWSAELETVPAEPDGWCRIVFSLLMDNAATRREQKRYRPGTHFTFQEGSRIVADGIVTKPEREEALRENGRSGERKS